MKLPLEFRSVSLYCSARSFSSSACKTSFLRSCIEKEPVFEKVPEKCIMFHQSWSPNLVANLLPISFVLRAQRWNRLYCPIEPDQSLRLAGWTRRLKDVIMWRGHSHALPLRCIREHVQVDSTALHTDMISRTKAPTSST
ncbi:Os10g0190600 [Oryza sativa Japonica Group]|uniref:Os10g0190600 protein n=1 Tax=Oryza sativa subsp. japonica TaxID=39947 RepID=A0A0N7KRJ4_ORYSJ|nr:hypothetical protein EE612_050446 [Oryza sativa]BAT10186.1 Os10g0190600 [Oryza sativa Japonica Group]